MSIFGNVTPVQFPDWGRTHDRAQQFHGNRLAMVLQHRQMQDRDTRQNWLAQNASRFANTDPRQQMNLLAELIAVPGGAEIALPRMDALRDDLQWSEAGGGAALPTHAAAAPALGGGGVRTGATIEVPATLDNVDLIARTILGEAANEGEAGQRAVAHVIANRMRQTGATGRDVVLAPSQFEPWGSRRQELLGIRTDDPRYIAARRFAEEAIAGRSQDPTNGATHFLNPDLQRQLGRQQPAWAPEGQGQRIGRHVFYTPGGGMRTGAGDTVPASATPSGSAVPDAAIAAVARNPAALPDVPGIDMAQVRRAAEVLNRFPENRRAAAVMQRYMHLAGLHRREDQAPVEIADPTSPTGRRLVRRQDAYGAAAPGAERNVQTVDLGDDGPQGAGRYRVNPDGTFTRIAAIPTRDDPNATGFNRANTLRDEYTRLTGDFRTVQTAYQNIRRAASSETGAGDMAMLYSFVKLLDPTSVVRESEFATAAQSGSFGERVQGAVNRILSGERLPASLRDAFRDEARTLYDTQRRQYGRVSDNYRDLARNFGIDPNNVVLPYDMGEDDDAQRDGGAAQGGVQLAPGVTAVPPPRAQGSTREERARQGGLPRVTSPAEAMRLPPGTVFLDDQGVRRVRP